MNTHLNFRVIGTAETVTRRVANDGAIAVPAPSLSPSGPSLSSRLGAIAFRSAIAATWLIVVSYALKLAVIG
jgi:hypothetical protein